MEMKKQGPGDDVKVDAVAVAAVHSLAEILECSRVSAAFVLWTSLLETFGAFDAEATKRLLRAIANEDAEKVAKYRNQIYAAHDAWAEKEASGQPH